MPLNSTEVDACNDGGNWSATLDGDLVRAVSFALGVVYALEVGVILLAGKRFILERWSERLLRGGPQRFSIVGKRLSSATSDPRDTAENAKKGDDRRSSHAGSVVGNAGNRRSSNVGSTAEVDTPGVKKKVDKRMSLPQKIFSLCSLGCSMQVVLWSLWGHFRHELAICDPAVIFIVAITYTLTMATAFHTVAVFLAALRRIITMQARRKVAGERLFVTRLIYAPGYIISVVAPALVLSGHIADLASLMRVLNLVHAFECLAVVVLVRKAFMRAVSTLGDAISMSLKTSGTSTARVVSLQRLRAKLGAAGLFVIGSTFSVAAGQLATALSSIFVTAPHAIFWLLFTVGAAISIWNVLCFISFWPSSARSKRWQRQSPSLEQSVAEGSVVYKKGSVVSVTDSDKKHSFDVTPAEVDIRRISSVGSVANSVASSMERADVVAAIEDS